MRLGFAENENDIHRGLCNKNDLRESGKENLNRECGRGVFVTMMTTTEMTTTGEVNGHHSFSSRYPSIEAVKTATNKGGGV